MQSEKPEPGKRDELAQSAPEGVTEPAAQEQGPELVDRARHIEQSHERTGSSPGPNGASNSAAPQPYDASTFRRPAAGAAANAPAHVDPAGAQPIRPDLTEPAYPLPESPATPVTAAPEAQQSAPPETVPQVARLQPSPLRSSPLRTPGSGHLAPGEPSVRPFAPPPRPVQPAQSPAVTVPGKPKGLLDLAPSEQLVREVDSGDDGRFVLTSHRLIFQGRSGDGALFASAAVEDITSIEFGRRARDSRSAWWGTIGMIAAIAVWQVTTNESVGAVAGAVVAGISALLLADYWFRPPGLVLRFGTAGGAVEGPVSGKRMGEAEELAAEVQKMRRSANGVPGRGYASPPGGSPGLY